MGIFRKRETKKIGSGNQKRQIAFTAFDFEDLSCEGYVSLADNPEIMAGCRKIAELIGSITIHLMANTSKGDQRVINELSRKIDIEPEKHMTRSTWIQGIVMNMLLYGKGNAIVVPHTYNGLIVNLEPIAADRVSFVPKGYRDYQVSIDGQYKNPDNLLHFVFNPDRTYLWKGKGVTASLKDVANNLKQAAKTENGFMASKWKPSIIVKVDALTEEFASKGGRQKLLESYMESSEVGEPWLIPAEQFQVEQVKPLSLADLAIKDTVELDKRTVAAILGVPPFLLGVGEYNVAAWNSFIQNTVKPIAISMQQEMTKKLILSEKMYIKFNVLSLMDWDIKTIASVFGDLSDKGIVTGNEVRDRLGMNQLDGLDDLRILENYIPSNMIGQQKKLIQGGDSNE